MEATGGFQAEGRRDVTGWKMGCMGERDGRSPLRCPHKDDATDPQPSFTGCCSRTGSSRQAGPGPALAGCAFHSGSGGDTCTEPLLCAECRRLLPCHLGRAPRSTGCAWPLCALPGPALPVLLAEVPPCHLSSACPWWSPVSWPLELQALLQRCRGPPPCPVAPSQSGVAWAGHACSLSAGWGSRPQE